VTASNQIHEGADNHLPGFDAAVMATVDRHSIRRCNRHLFEYFRRFLIHLQILLDGVAL
jgi:hypothetical protein